MSFTVFSDTFEVKAINSEKKIFDKVDRLEAHADTYGFDLIIDVNCELWKREVGDKIVLTLATSLTGEVDAGTYNQTEIASLLDTCEYAMHGRVFNFSHKGGHKVEIDVSYGGLLMRLSGDQRHLSGVELDQNIYCLLSKA